VEAAVQSFKNIEGITLAKTNYTKRISKQSKPGGARKRGRTGYGRPPAKPVQKREPMLNLRHRIAFKYDLELILKHSDVEEKYINTIVANIIAKASQNSIKEAKRFIFESEEKGIISPSVGKQIVVLLNKNTRYR